MIDAQDYLCIITVPGTGSSSDWSFCNVSSPCSVGQGDRDSDYECQDSLKCGSDNCRDFNPNAEEIADCCIPVSVPCPVPSSGNLIKIHNHKFSIHTQIKEQLQSNCSYDTVSIGIFIALAANGAASSSDSSDKDFARLKQHTDVMNYSFGHNQL